MATKLFPLLQVVGPTSTRGTNESNLQGNATGWTSYPLTTIPGAAHGGNFFSASTIAGPVTGLEINPGYEFVSAPLAAAVTISNTISFNIYAYENSTNTNATIGCIIERLNSSMAVVSTISQSTAGTELTTSTSNLATWSDTTPTSTDLEIGDRIRVRLYADDATAVTLAAGSVWITVGAHSGWTGYTYIEFQDTLSFDLGGIWRTEEFSTEIVFDTWGHGNYAPSINGLVIPAAVPYDFAYRNGDLRQSGTWNFRNDGGISSNCVCELPGWESGGKKLFWISSSFTASGLSYAYGPDGTISVVTGLDTSDAFYDIAYSPEPRAVTVGINGTACVAAYSTNGTSITRVTSGLPVATGLTVCYDSTNSLFILMTDTGEIYTSPTGATWTSRTSPYSNVWRCVRHVPQLGKSFACGDNGRLAYSSNGTTWTGITTNTTTHLGCLAYNPTTGVLLVGARHNGSSSTVSLFLYSTDGGTSWGQLTNLLPQTGLWGGPQGFVYDGTMNTFAFWTTNAGTDLGSGHVFWYGDLVKTGLHLTDADSTVNVSSIEKVAWKTTGTG